MKLKLKMFRVWPLAMVVMLLLPAGYAGTTSANGNARIHALLADPMSLFAMRSSGGRGAGALVQSKLAHASTATDTAPDDFLGLIQAPDLPSDGEGFSSVPLFPLQPAFDGPPAFDPTPFQSLPGFDDAPESGVFPNGIGGGESDVGMGGRGFAPGPPGRPPAAPPVIVPPLLPSPVPEPGTWLMIVAGFLAVGSALRSRHRSKAASRADTNSPLPTSER